MSGKVGMVEHDESSCESVEDLTVGQRCCGHTEDDEGALGGKRHHCTDHICLGVTLAFVCLWLYICSYAVGHGNMVKVTHGRDAAGNICGFRDLRDDATATFETKPLVFWCLNKTTGEPADRVCVDACPLVSATSGYANCANGVSYKSAAYLNRFCMPDDDAMYEKMRKKLQEVPGYGLIKEAMGLKHNIPLLIFVLFLTVVLGYVYLWVLKTLACCLIWSSIGIIVVFFLGAGGYMFTQIGTFDEDVQPLVYAGIAVSVAVGGVFALMACCCHEKIDTAIGVVEATSECMWDLPSLLFVPLISVFQTALCIPVLAYFFIYLLSVGDMRQATVENLTSEGTWGTAKLMYKDNEQNYILIFIFAFFWAMEFITALSQYVLAYMTGQWFFSAVDEEGDKSHVPSGLLWWGYLTGIGFHAGTMAFGACIIAIFRFVRLVIAYMISQLEKEGNVVAAMAAKCLLCCVTCVQKCIEFVNKNAYMDVAINSNSFCVAAKQAFTFIAEAIVEIPILNGATTVFQVAGCLSITAGTSSLVWLMVNNLSRWTDPLSAHYVSDPVPITVVSGVIAFLIAYGFMQVFDMVADTLLYCFVFSKRTYGAEALKYVPQGELRDILENYK